MGFGHTIQHTVKCLDCDTRIAAKRWRCRSCAAWHWLAKAEAYAALHAHRMVNGWSGPEPCEVCGAPNGHAHHDDYTKPLAIRWLCKQHHHAHHQRERRKQLETRLCV